MIDMKMSASEMESKTMLGGPEEPDEQYSYGLQIRLEDSQLEKLGIKEMPKAGSYLTIRAIACVCSTTVSESDDSGEHKCLTLQIEQMEVSKDQESDAAKKLYGE